MNDVFKLCEERGQFSYVESSEYRRAMMEALQKGSRKPVTPLENIREKKDQLAKQMEQGYQEIHKLNL